MSFEHGQTINHIGGNRFTFPLALLTAIAIEGTIILGFISMHNSRQVVVSPQVTHLTIVTQPPHVPPAPPKPAPPKPAPLPPKPVPLPPKPKPIPKPDSKPRPKPRPLPKQPAPMPPAPQQPAIPQPVVPPPISPAMQETALQAYASAVHDAVQSHLRVPRMIDLLHLSGITSLAVKIAPDGRILSVSVIHSSGETLIDQSAVASVKVMHFPPFGQAMPTHPVTVYLAVQLDSINS